MDTVALPVNAILTVMESKIIWTNALQAHPAPMSMATVAQIQNGTAMKTECMMRMICAPTLQHLIPLIVLDVALNNAIPMAMMLWMPMICAP